MTSYPSSPPLPAGAGQSKNEFSIPPLPLTHTATPPSKSTRAIKEYRFDTRGNLWTKVRAAKWLRVAMPIYFNYTGQQSTLLRSICLLHAHDWCADRRERCAVVGSGASWFRQHASPPSLIGLHCQCGTVDSATRRDDRPTRHSQHDWKLGESNVMTRAVSRVKLTSFLSRQRKV